VKTNAVQALGARYGLDRNQQGRLRSILTELEADEHAPTAIRKAEEAVDAHLADSLVALDLEAIRSAETIADLGAGAGFPGLALAVALADAEIALVESQRRECQFLEKLRALTGIENVRVVRTRAEEWQAGLSQHDVVVARALAAQPVVLEYAAPLLRLGGALVDWRGKRGQAEEDASLVAAEALGLRLVDIRKVQPFAGATDRHLHQFVKVEETPERFPRRAGVARKRPLGARPPRAVD
jgi:16S rRNA (guanine527-N7)-methyltransferase